MLRKVATVVEIATVVALTTLLAACSPSHDSAGPTPTTAGRITTTTIADTEPTTTTDSAEVVIELVEVARLDRPIALAARPGTDDLYVAEQTGLVRRLEPQGGSTFTTDRMPVLDLRNQTSAAGERGLLGMTFSPDGSRLYVDYTDTHGDTRITEYTMDGDHADGDSARELLVVDQPFANHNGGHLAFGPDGYLYIGLGDGGSNGDPHSNGQNNEILLGKILRIDPFTSTDVTPYRIPSDNPFATSAEGRPEIWISGVRNPWRFSFDIVTGDMWIGDVGQDTWEEIDLIPAGDAGRGANLGWSLFEGNHPFNGDDSTGLIPPVHEYSHDDGNCGVTGGYVYRGTAIPGLVGRYIFGDHCRAELLASPFGADRTAGRSGDGPDVVFDTALRLGVSVATDSLVSFGQDNRGEIYVLSSEGPVYLISPA